MESLVLRRSLIITRPALALAAVLALSGCGRKGPLEPPPQVSAAQTTGSAPTTGATPNGGSAETGNPAASTPGNGQLAATSELDAAQTRALGNADTPGLIQSPNTVYEQSAAEKLAAATVKKERPINTPDIKPTNTGKPFFLDPLVR